jgi:hypothetical protein
VSRRKRHGGRRSVAICFRLVAQQRTCNEVGIKIIIGCRPDLTKSTAFPLVRYPPSTTFPEHLHSYTKHPSKAAGTTKSLLLHRMSLEAVCNEQLADSSDKWASSYNPMVQDESSSKVVTGEQNADRSISSSSGPLFVLRTTHHGRSASSNPTETSSPEWNITSINSTVDNDAQNDVSQCALPMFPLLQGSLVDLSLSYLESELLESRGLATEALRVSRQTLLRDEGSSDNNMAGEST